MKKKKKDNIKKTGKMFPIFPLLCRPTFIYRHSLIYTLSSYTTFQTLITSNNIF